MDGLRVPTRRRRSSHHLLQAARNSGVSWEGGRVRVRSLTSMVSIHEPPGGVVKAWPWPFSRSERESNPTEPNTTEGGVFPPFGCR